MPATPLPTQLSARAPAYDAAIEAAAEAHPAIASAGASEDVAPPPAKRAAPIPGGRSTDPRQRSARLQSFMKREGLTQAEVSRRTGIANSTLSQMISGKYKGNVESRWEQLDRFMDDHKRKATYRDRVSDLDQYVETPTGRRIRSVFEYCRFIPDMGAIVGQPGLGKSSEAHEYARVNDRVACITASPLRHSPTHVIGDICVAAGLGYSIKAVEARARLSEHLSAETALIVVDEAQHLKLPALEELRYLHDTTRCGVVLMGNPSILTTIRGGTRKAEFAQLSSRFGAPMTLPKRPDAGDVQALLDAWSITDPRERALLADMAAKPGALRSMMKVLKAARSQVEARSQDDFYDLLRSARAMYMGDL